MIEKQRAEDERKLALKTQLEEIRKTPATEVDPEFSRIE